MAFDSADTFTEVVITRAARVRPAGADRPAAERLPVVRAAGDAAGHRGPARDPRRAGPRPGGAAFVVVPAPVRGRAAGPAGQRSRSRAIRRPASSCTWPAAPTGPAIEVSCAGTLVADDAAELRAQGLDRSPWVGRGLTGLDRVPRLPGPARNPPGRAARRRRRGLRPGDGRLRARCVEAELDPPGPRAAGHHQPPAPAGAAAGPARAARPPAPVRAARRWRPPAAGRRGTPAADAGGACAGGLLAGEAAPRRKRSRAPAGGGSRRRCFHPGRWRRCASCRRRSWCRPAARRGSRRSAVDRDGRRVRGEVALRLVQRPRRPSRSWAAARSRWSAPRPTPAPACAPPLTVDRQPGRTPGRGRPPPCSIADQPEPPVDLTAGVPEPELVDDPTGPLAQPLRRPALAGQRQPRGLHRPARRAPHAPALPAGPVRQGGRLPRPRRPRQRGGAGEPGGDPGPRRTQPERVTATR